jgi:Phosphotransferase enzyme family
MDDYQKSVVAQFFEVLPTRSQLSCHKFVLDHVAPVLLPNPTGKVDIQPSPFQGSMSYTTILYSANDSQRIVVQFRGEKQDLFGVTEANRIYGTLVPLVTYRGMYEGLFVYTSPLAEGTPYIHILMSSPDFKMPLNRKMATVIDLADIITRKVRANNSASDLSSALDDIQSTVNTYTFRNTGLRSRIFTCIGKLLPQLRDIASLPIALTHQDLAPFNYLIDDSTGRIQAVLDWDGAVYLPVGSNFHFVESLFGFMTPSGWEDTEDRQELEAAFYARALTALAAQGFGGVTKEQLELQKAIGILQYFVERLLKFKDDRTEQYLDGYLWRLTFMRGSMPPY